MSKELWTEQSEMNKIFHNSLNDVRERIRELEKKFAEAHEGEGQ